jgi:hypothetical protein
MPVPPGGNRRSLHRRREYPVVPKCGLPSTGPLPLCRPVLSRLRTGVSPAVWPVPPGERISLTGGIRSLSEIKDASATTRPGISGKSSGVRVRALVLFHNNHSFVIPQGPCELTVSHVHCVHLPGPSLEKHLGETAGGGTDIHADPILRGYAKGIEPLEKFVGSPTDPFFPVIPNFQRGIRRTREPVLSTREPPTKTFPARMSAWAFVLVSTSPLDTSSLSIRSFLELDKQFTTFPG